MIGIKGKGLWPHSFNLLTPQQLGSGKGTFDYQITNMTDELSLATFCHKNGHMICDFPDLYEYGNESSGIGAFCLLGAGANANPNNPTDIYLKYLAGWAQPPTRITAGLNATVSVGKNQYFIHRKDSIEYFIIENRNKAAQQHQI
jgi:M6 family metalloprotease-like protein